MTGKGAAKWYRWDEVPREELHERLSRRLITGDQVMLAHVYLKKGCVVPKHSHDNEQFTYILEGALQFLVGEEADEIVVRGGSAALAGERATRGARAGGHARRGHLLPAARGLAQQDGRLPTA